MNVERRHAGTGMRNDEAPRIIVVRVGAMGDVLHALPAVARLRAAMPQAHIGWAIEPRWEALLRAAGATVRDRATMPLVDTVHPVEAKQWNRRPFSLATAHSIAALRRELRAQRYDVAIDLQGTLRSAVIARLSGAAKVVGSASPREGVARWLYRTRASAGAQHVTEQAWQILQATSPQSFQRVVLAGGSEEPAQHTSSDRTRRDALLPRSGEAEAWWRERAASLCGGRPAVLLAATAGWGAKEWPVESFAALSAALAARGYCVLLNTTPGSVDAVTARVMELVCLRHPEAVPQVHALGCTLPQLIAATRTVRAVIAGDTGPLHLAAVLAVPTVGLFGPTAPERTGPQNDHSVNLRDDRSVTDHRRHTETEAGLAQITVAAVLDAIDRVLGGVDMLFEGDRL